MEQQRRGSCLLKIGAPDTAFLIHTFIVDLVISVGDTRTCLLHRSTILRVSCVIEMTFRDVITRGEIDAQGLCIKWCQ